MIIRLGTGEWFGCQAELVPAETPRHRGFDLRFTDGRGAQVARVGLLDHEISQLSHALADALEREEP